MLLSHKLSPVKTAKNSTTNCFDCPLQTNQNDAVRLVCYSLRKRINLQQAYEKRSPIKITDVVTVKHWKLHLSNFTGTRNLHC